MNHIREQYKNLTELLIKKQKTITTMESCTGGLIASLITDTEGASAAVKGAFVTYCNEAKIQQGVSEKTIAEYGVYSKETAKAMANACKEQYGSDIGIGVTGTFGNVDVENEDSEPGHIYFAIARNGEVLAYEIVIDKQPSRYSYKYAVAENIANKLLVLLKD